MYTPRYFLIKELVPRQVWENEGDQAILHVHEDLLRTLDDLREFFGVPMTVNNWHNGGPFQYRCFRPAEATVGAVGSMHRKDPCEACDFDVKGFKAIEARRQILAFQKKFPFIRRMEGNVTWVHIDSKPVPGQKGIYLFKP